MIVTGVRLLDIHLVELPLMCPLDDPFVLKGVRKCESLKNPRGGLLDAVPVRLEAVLHVEHTVRYVLLDLFLHLEIVLFPFRLGESGVPSVELGLFPDRGVKVIE